MTPGNCFKKHKQKKKRQNLGKMLKKNKANIDIGKRQRDLTKSKLTFDNKVHKSLEQTSLTIERNVIQVNIIVTY